MSMSEYIVDTQKLIHDLKEKLNELTLPINFIGSQETAFKNTI